MGTEQPERASSPSVVRRIVICGVALSLAWIAAPWFAGSSADGVGQDPAARADRPTAPGLRWTRGLAPAEATLPRIAKLSADEPLRLQIDHERPLHCYVLAHSLLDGNVALWPSTALNATPAGNPLPAGAQWLPGRHTGIDLHWHGGSAPLTALVVLASERPLEGVTEWLAKRRQMGNAAFPGRAVLGRYAAPDSDRGEEGEGARVDRDVDHPLFREALETRSSGLESHMQALPGHPGVWFHTSWVRVDVPLGGDADARAQLQAVQQQLEDLAREHGPKPPADATSSPMIGPLPPGPQPPGPTPADPNGPRRR